VRPKALLTFALTYSHDCSSACGSDCINATNVPYCANSLSDPACVCSSGSKSDSEGVNNIFKCFFETCDEAGAANSFNAFQMNCGQLVSLPCRGESKS
jgi:hypothetical protein